MLDELEEYSREHKDVLSLIRKYKCDFEELGRLTFETRKGSALAHGGFAKDTEYAVLSEDQATQISNRSCFCKGSKLLTA